MKIKQELFLTNAKTSLLEMIKNINDNNTTCYISVVNTIEKETLVHAYNIADIDNRALNILVCEDNALSEGVLAFIMHTKIIRHDDFTSCFNISSNDYQILKNSYKEKLAESFSNKGNLLADINLITDELLMNAFFNAPIDNLGKYYNKEKERIENAVLDRKVEISLMRKSDITAVSCKDLYGSLDTGTVMDYIRKGTVPVKNIKNSTRKGAGIGLAFLYFYSDILVFDIDKRKSSDIFCVKFDRKKNFKIVSILNREKEMFNYKLTENSNELIIALNGNIDEDANFKNLNLSKFSKVTIDFNGVEGINSCGIREWINFRNTLDHKEVVYKNCRKIVIDQINIVHGFIKDNISVESLYLPYFCEACDIEDSVLVKLSDILKEGVIQLKGMTCPNCKKTMEFDEIEKQYFNFIKFVKKTTK